MTQTSVASAPIVFADLDPEQQGSVRAFEVDLDCGERFRRLARAGRWNERLSRASLRLYAYVNGWQQAWRASDGRTGGW